MGVKGIKAANPLQRNHKINEWSCSKSQIIWKIHSVYSYMPAFWFHINTFVVQFWWHTYQLRMIKLEKKIILRVSIKFWLKSETKSDLYPKEYVSGENLFMSQIIIWAHASACLLSLLVTANTTWLASIWIIRLQL